jgi:hypothetical protein
LIKEDAERAAKDVKLLLLGLSKKKEISYIFIPLLKFRCW